MTGGAFGARDLLAMAGTFLAAVALARLVRLPLPAWARGHRLGARAAPWILLAVVAPLPLRWPDPLVQAVTMATLFVLVWKGVTADIDLGGDDPLWNERAAISAGWLLALLNPAFLGPTLWLAFWRFDALTHHSTLPLRMALLGTGFVVHCNGARLLGLAPPDGAPALLVMLACHGLAYLIPATGKARLGPRPLSWVKENRLHALMASAFSWGWARFVGERTWLRAVQLTRRLDCPIQALVLAVEASSLLLLLDHRLAVVCLAAFAALHLGVFLASGILFWEWIATNGIFLWVVLTGPPALVSRLFGPTAWLCGLAVMLACLVSGRLWRPFRLSWWDTPFTQRVHWEVVGASGKVYGLYNDFLCPHERQYGQTHGYFMTSQPICTLHLGESESRALRDAVWSTRGAPAALAALKAEWGSCHRDEAETARHQRYLTRFFSAWNRGRRKRVLPRFLRWAKAPGGQCFYWGRRPGFRGQEPVTRVIVSYREEYFDGQRYRVITDEVLRQFDV